MEDFKSMSIGDRIKYLRKAKLDLTQTEFGNKINVKTSTIGGWESGARKVLERPINDIVREYNVNYEWLVYGEGEIFIENDEDIYNLIDRVMTNDSEYHKFLIKQVASMSDEQIETIKSLIEYFTPK